MRAAAESSGIRLLLLSAFRSIQQQGDLVRRKLAQGMPLERVLEQTAYPGHSEHHTGCAVDIGAHAAPHLEESFERTAEFGWLNTHAGYFGFRLSYPRGNRNGITYEPWHWCYASPSGDGENFGSVS